jgi:hypothetical protein
MFTIKVDANRTVLKFNELPARLRGKLLSTVQVLDAELVSLARAKASNDLVDIHSGKYLASIKGDTRNTENRISGIAYSDAPQASILEYGGTIPFHEILPNVATALAFNMGGGQVFAAGVAMPDVTIKKRGVLHSALYQLHGKIVSDMGAAVNETARAL